MPRGYPERSDTYRPGFDGPHSVVTQISEDRKHTSLGSKFNQSGDKTEFKLRDVEKSAFTESVVINL